MNKSLVVIILFLAFQLTFRAAQAKSADSDLVVPVGNAQDDLALPDPKKDAEQDAIQVQRLKEGEVNEDAAQSRRPPPKASSHFVVVPDYNPEDEDVESSAGQVTTKVKVPKFKREPAKYYADIRVGSYYPANLQGDTSGITYANVYGNGSVPMIELDYEWDILRVAGKLGLKAGLGAFTASGNGRFVHNPSIISDESISLFVLPLTVGGVYHFQYWDNQIIIPYAEGGMDYFGMVELRDDATSITQAKYGGSPAAHLAGGLQLQLDFLDRAGLWNMGKEYGIKHLYLTAGIRQFFAIGGIYDFSAMMFEGGFAFEF